MTVMVTGGAGYIGSHICKAVAEEGFTPVTVDSLLYGHRSAVQWGPLEVLDLRDQAKLRAVFERYKPVAVIHCAALTYVGESVQKPLLYYDNNVGGTISLLQAMGRPLPIILSSTCAIYGQPLELPLRENHPQKPLNPYGRTKQMVEQIIRDAGIPYAFLRYFNAAGSGGEIGEDHDPETHLIPLAISAALQGTPLKVFGTDYETPDGTAIRDYIHVSDLSKAHSLSLKKLLNGSSALELNLGTGEGISVRQVIEAVEKVSGRSITLEYGPRREGDASILVADRGLATELLGWAPAYQNFEDIVKTAYAWQIKKESF